MMVSVNPNDRLLVALDQLEIGGTAQYVKYERGREIPPRRISDIII